MLQVRRKTRSRTCIFWFQIWSSSNSLTQGETGERHGPSRDVPAELLRHRFCFSSQLPRCFHNTVVLLSTKHNFSAKKERKKKATWQLRALTLNAGHGQAVVSIQQHPLCSQTGVEAFSPSPVLWGFLSPTVSFGKGWGRELPTGFS